MFNIHAIYTFSVFTEIVMLYNTTVYAHGPETFDEYMHTVPYHT